MTFWETIERGEYVMFALALIVIACIVILWARSVTLGKNKRKTHKLMQRVRDYVVEGDIDNAIQLCGQTTSSGAKVVASGLHKMGSPIAEVKEAIDDTAQKEKEKLGKGMRWLRTFAVISPLLGLGGTLVGIIDRLSDLGASGNAVDTAAVCGAIAPTIVTTVAGLGVGILALIFLAILEGKITTAKRKLDRVGNEVLELLNEPA